MVHLARVAGLDDEADRGAEALADQVMVDAGGREQRRDRRPGPARPCRSERMMMLSPAWTAISASANSCSSAASMPSAPSLDRIGDVERLRPERVVLHAADGADLLEVLVGQDRLAHFEALAACRRPSRSSTFGRGPMNETRLITSSSRIESIGGLVTCAKFCLK